MSNVPILASYCTEGCSAGTPLSRSVQSNEDVVDVSIYRQEYIVKVVNHLRSSLANHHEDLCLTQSWC